MNKNQRSSLLRWFFSTLGFIVDDVADIYKLKEDEFKPAPRSFSNGGGSFIKAIGRVDDKFVLLLDLFKMLNEIEEKEVNAALGAEKMNI